MFAIAGDHVPGFCNETCLEWIADRKKRRKLKTVQTIWRNRRNYLAKLAAFHGYMLFKWEDSEVAKYDLAFDVNDAAREVAADTDGKSVNQQRHMLSKSEVADVLKYAVTLRARQCALLLAFCDILLQTLARSRQVCKLNKVHVSLYALQLDPLAGPLQMLQLGDRHKHKVEKIGDMAHSVMRTFKPSLQCPVFALAVEVALDARERKGEQYQDLCKSTKGAILCKAYMPIFALIADC